MTPEQLTLVARTIDSVEASLDEFTAAFYFRLFSSAPEVRELFPADSAEQRRRFAAEVCFFAAIVSRPARLRLAGVRPGSPAPPLRSPPSPLRPRGNRLARRSR